MAPLRIGISANLMYPDKTRGTYAPKMLIYGEESLYHWIAKGGAIPYLIPRLSGALSLKDIVADLDGIVFSGGADVSPRSYGEEPIRPEWAGDYERDQYEIELFHTAKDAGKPILGVCRGHQLINVALGGSLYQDTATQKDSAKIHRDAEIYDKLSHDIVIEPGSVVSEIFEGKTAGRTNSIHHQAIKDLAPGLSVQARSVPDQIIEAFWLEDSENYVLGIQWHPEWVCDPDFLDPDLISAHFLNRARQSRA